MPKRVIKQKDDYFKSGSSELPHITKHNRDRPEEDVNRSFDQDDYFYDRMKTHHQKNNKGAE